MDALKNAQVNLAFTLHRNSIEYSKLYFKVLESLDDEQLAALNVKIYNYLKEVYNIEK